MAKFVDINSLTEKVNPDGNEQIQISDTQKLVWKNALMNSGGFIGAILSYATQYAMGNTTDRQTIISMLGQLFYNTGSRADSFFRFVCGSVTIRGGTHKQEYFGVVFYDDYYTRTYAVLFGFENGAVPVTFFQRQGNYVTDSPIDDNFVTNIINGTSWTKSWSLNSQGTQGTIYTSDVVAGDSENPIIPATTFALPNVSNSKLDALLNQILFCTGIRGSGLHSRNFRFINATYNIPNTTNVQCHWGVAWYNSYHERTYCMLVNTEKAESKNIQIFQKQGAGLYDDAIDDELVEKVLSLNTWSRVVSFGGSESTPIDAVLTMFPSGYRTVIPGENLTTNLTSGTLKVQVQSLLTAQVKNGPFRDAVIDVPYGVTVQFADQVGIVYKADGVDGFTATSGRKVYTIHFVPTTSSTTNITFRAFVNVTNYK